MLRYSVMYLAEGADKWRKSIQNTHNSILVDCQAARGNMLPQKTLKFMSETASCCFAAFRFCLQMGISMQESGGQRDYFSENTLHACSWFYWGDISAWLHEKCSCRKLQLCIQCVRGIVCGGPCKYPIRVSPGVTLKTWGRLGTRLVYTCYLLLKHYNAKGLQGSPSKL